MSIIKMSDITKKYGDKTILDHFNMEISEGDFVAITGPSGCGKSTLLNILGLIEPFDSGEYEIFGIKNPNIDSSNAVHLLRDKISYLFQNFALINDNTVYYNLEIALHFLKHSKIEKDSLIASALETVGLSGFENKKIYQLSGGEQQRVALARIMLKPSKLILADEPTGSLDVGNRDKIMDILTSLNQKGKTIIIVTHDQNIVACAKNVIRLTER